MCKSGNTEKKVNCTEGKDEQVDVDGSDSESEQEARVSQVGFHMRINALSGKKRRIWVEVNINGTPVKMQMDTASDVTIINESKAKDIPGLVITPHTFPLTDYGSHPITVVGTARVVVKYQDQQSEQVLTIVRGKGPTLLGMDWINVMELDYLNWGKIRQTMQVEETVSFQETPSRSMEEIIKDYEEVFSGELGTVRNTKASLELKPEAVPKFFRPRPVPYGIKSQVEREILSLEAAGVWERVTYSDLATPLVPVSKPDGGVRLCGDYKSTVNSQLQVAQHPLPNIQDMLAALGVCRVFSKIDLKTAFQQLVMDDKSQEYCTVNTHMGLFRPTRLPYGIASSPAIWQQTMDKIFNAMPGVFCFVDDILIAGRDDLEHQERLVEVLNRIKENGLRIKKEKCHFNVSSIEYLGFVVDKDGVHKTDDKVRAVRDAKVPTDVKELQAFLGLVTFYGKFVKDLATIASPLYALLGKGVPWVWDDRCQEAVKRIKAEITSPKFLVHFDQDLPLKLVTDASDVGLGAVLAHVMPDGEERPIAFASRLLNPAEKNYSQIEKEALSLIYGVTKFHMYLYGREDFTLVTDHKPLLAIVGPHSGVPKVMAARLYRCSVILAAYNYTIEFRSTTKMGNADALSRLPVDIAPVEHDPIVMMVEVDGLPPSSKDVALQTADDPVLLKVLHNLGKSRYAVGEDPEFKPYFEHWTELSSEGGCIFRGDRIVIPSSLRDQVLEQLHEDHQGIVKTKALAQTYVWWPGMDSDIERYVRGCMDCAVHQNNPKPFRLHAWEFPDRPWQRLLVDFAGPFLGRSFLIFVDAYSKWPEVIPMATTTSWCTIKALLCLIATHGLPDRIVSDNGPQFTSAEFARFCQQNGIRHTFSAPYHPATNGEAERFVQTFKRAMKCRKATAFTVPVELSKFLFTYRNTPHSTTGESPASLLMGRRVRWKLDLLKPALDKKCQQDDSQKGKGNTEMRQFVEGETVLVRLYGTDKWGVGQVKERLGCLHYNVNIQGRVVKRHVDQLRSYMGEKLDHQNPSTHVPLHHVPLHLDLEGNEMGDPAPLPVQGEIQTPPVPADPSLPDSSSPQPERRVLSPRRNRGVQTASPQPERRVLPPRSNRGVPPQVYGDFVWEPERKGPGEWVEFPPEN